MGLHAFLLPLLLGASLLVSSSYDAAAADPVSVGVCWGRNSWQTPPPEVVVQLLKDNGITRLKLFSADADILRALSGSGIEVSVMVANEYLSVLAANQEGARLWISRNIAPFASSVNIKYINVGNEPFLTDYGGAYTDVVVPALQNIYQALQDWGLDSRIKLSVPLNLDILAVSYPPSAAVLRPDIAPQVTAIAKLLAQSQSHFEVNIYPFLTLYQQSQGSPLPLSQVFVDSGPSSTASVTNGSAFVDPANSLVYSNIFDGSYDATATMLSKLGYGQLEVFVGEVGWPSDGNGDTRGYATLANAQRFNNDIVRHMSNGQGTPLRPNQVIQGYLFSLVDEDNKTTGAGPFERHWGILYADLTPKYSLDLTGTGKGNTLVGAMNVPTLAPKWCVAKAGVDAQLLASALGYACGTVASDCTPTTVGSSCFFGGDLRNMSSYAFNSYYQLHGQDPSACDFGGVGMITSKDPSSGSCKFLLGMTAYNPTSSNSAMRSRASLSLSVAALALALLA